MNITCKVTQEFIDEGCHAASACPVAKAILEQLAPGVFVAVTAANINIHRLHDDEEYGSRWETLADFYTPWNASTWIRAYDSLDENRRLTGVSVHPFEFEINVPPAAVAA